MMALVRLPDPIGGDQPVDRAGAALALRTAASIVDEVLPVMNNGLVAVDRTEMRKVALELVFIQLVNPGQHE
jgi:hypothetical protein